MYKVVLADDEDEIREGMASRINWEEYGFEIVGLARNGVEALELVDLHRPEVIITDIQMPLLNGLEFIEAALKILPTVKIVVFSGYDNFEYAQQAIKLRVTSYLLKPFSSKDFEITLAELKEQMDIEKRELRNIEALEKMYQDSLPAIREKYLMNCIMGQYGKNSLLGNSKLFKADIEKTEYTVAVIDLSRHLIISDREKLFDGKEELLPLAMTKIIESILSPYTSVEVLVIGDYLGVVIKMSEDISISLILSLLNEVSKELVQVTGIRYFIGLGSSYKRMERLNLSYQEGLSALEYSFMMQDSEESTIYIKDIDKPLKKIPLSFTESSERELRQLLLLGDQHKIKDYFDKIFMLLENERIDFKNYQMYLIEILVSILKLLELQELETKPFFGVEMGELLSTIKYYTVKEIKENLIKTCTKIAEEIQYQAQDNTKVIINEAKLLVEKNYHLVECGLDMISDKLHLSSTYFSSLFKKETGESFISYLTQVRLDEAEKLLIETNKKTYEITEKVGYQDANYFSYVFKKKYGISPIKYRKEHREAINEA